MTAIGRARRYPLQRALGWLVDNLELVGMAVLLLAAFFPAAPPTAHAFTEPGYTNLWSQRLGPGNVFELGLLVFFAAWLLRAAFVSPRTTNFDRPLALLALALLALQALALPSSLGDIRYLQADAERILLLVAGYFVASRCIRDLRDLHNFTTLLAIVICVRAAELILVYGVSGETEFTTILGRSALLITEDGLLLLLPVALAWGALVDGRLTLWASLATLLGTASVFVVNLLSLRRGAVLMLGAAVLARSLVIGTRRLLLAAGLVLLLVAISVAAGPGRTIVDQVRYTASSSLLQSNDASSSQRQAEIENLGRNLNGTEWITGRGIGVLWRAEVASPVDIASFGGEENALMRLGWHVYGLDWTYKFGLLGVALILATGFVLARRIFAIYRTAAREIRGFGFSLAVCAPPFVLLTFTNPRIALMGGIVVGLLSRWCDLARARPSAGELA